MQDGRSSNDHDPDRSNHVVSQTNDRPSSVFSALFIFSELSKLFVTNRTEFAAVLRVTDGYRTPVSVFHETDHCCLDTDIHIM